MNKKNKSYFNIPIHSYWLRIFSGYGNIMDMSSLRFRSVDGYGAGDQVLMKSTINAIRDEFALRMTIVPIDIRNSNPYLCFYIA